MYNGDFDFDRFQEEDPALFYDCQEQEMDNLYHKHFLALSRKCQQIIQYTLMKKSCRQISQLMGLGSEQYARKRKYQCRKSLIKRIHEDPEYKILMQHV